MKAPSGTPDTRYADRSSRGKLRVTGPQRGWYLHQVTTQAFEGISEGEHRSAAMLTHHGRMIGFFEAVAIEDAILIHFEDELSSVLPDVIRKYVFATRVEIQDAADMALVLVVGTVPELTIPSVVQPTEWVGAPAAYLWIDAACRDAAIEELRAGGAIPISESELELMRIAAGVPRWGREMNEKTFPQEVSIDDRAVHYDKGCYTGQEAMAKIHFRGKVNRKLVRLTADREIAVGEAVRLGDSSVGTVTSAARTGRQWVGLALVKHDVPAESEVAVGETSALVRAAA